MCMNTTATTVESLRERTGTDLEMMSIVAVTMENPYTVVTITTLGAATILSITIPVSRPTIETALSAVPMTIVGLTIAISESHRPSTRTTVIMRLLVGSSAAIMSGIMGIVMSNIITFAARTLEDITMPRRKLFMTTVTIAAKLQAGTSLAVINIRGARHTKVTTSTHAVTRPRPICLARPITATMVITHVCMNHSPRPKRRRTI